VGTRRQQRPLRSDPYEALARRVLGIPEVESIMQQPPAPIPSLRAAVPESLEF
jgi:hypothetical protein